MPNIEQARATLSKLLDRCDIGVGHPCRIELMSRLNALDNKIINMLISVVETKVNDVEYMLNFVNQTNLPLRNVYNSTTKALIVPHPTNPEMLRVYPNIILNRSGVSDLKNICVFDATEIFKDFLKDYNEAMENEYKRQAWETDERTRKRLEEYIDMPTARVLTRHVKWDTSKVTDATIRDFAASIDGLRKPIEIKFAEAPEDFTIMYGTGPSSCMSGGSANANRWQYLTAKKLCPPSFYAYFPYTKGAYALKGKTVVARVILFKYPNKDTWYYGRIYSSNTEHHRKFVESLELQGIISLNKKGDYSPHRLYSPPIGTSFDIPGISCGNDEIYCMPWPYFDNMEYYGRGFYASFDVDTKKFTITYSGEENLNMLPINNQGGLLISIDYISQECKNCGVSITNKNNRLSTHDGTIYCSQTCARSDGYAVIKTIGGVETWQKPTEFNVKVFGRDLYFTNIEAAKRNGYAPLLDDDSCIPEDGGDFFVTDTAPYHWIHKATGEMWFSRNPVEPPNFIPIFRHEPIKNVFYDDREALEA